MSTRILIDSSANVCVSQASEMKGTGEYVKTLRLGFHSCWEPSWVQFTPKERLQNAGSLSVLVPGLEIGQKEKGTEDLRRCALQLCAHGNLWGKVEPSLPLVPYRSRWEGTGRRFCCPFHSISEVKNVSKIKVLDRLGSIIISTFSHYFWVSTTVNPLGIVINCIEFLLRVRCLT